MENQPVSDDMASLVAEIRNQASQIASMKQTIEAQDRQLKQHTKDLVFLRPYIDDVKAASHNFLEPYAENKDERSSE